MYAISRLAKDRSGAAAMEYGLAAALIAIAIFTVFAAMSGNLEKALDNIAAGAFPKSTLAEPGKAAP